MKKIVALIMALALILTATAAMAAEFYDPKTGDLVSPPALNYDSPILMDKSQSLIPGNGKAHAYKNWTANLEEGTHSCDGKTVDCAFEYFTLDGVAMYVCPVCGNLNGETVVPEVKSSYLQINRIEIVGVVGPMAWNTNGKYIVRMMAMPEDSEAACLITACHEAAGVALPAEALYNYVVPVDGRNLTLKKAYFGGLTDIAGSVTAGVNGLQIRPTKPSSCFGAFLLMK